MADNTEMIAKYRQLVSNGVDPTRAKGLLQQAMQVQPQQPVQQPGIGQTIKDVGEGVVSYAGSIPKVIAESGILDKPLAALGQGVGNIGRKLGLNVASPEVIQQRAIQQPFSQFAAGSQVGGNTENKVAKGVEKGLNIAEMVTGGAALAKGMTKGATKRGIKDIIKETEKLSDKRGALQAGKLVEQRTGIKKRLLGGKDVVKPSNRTNDAVNTIITEIKGASKKPVKLYGQVTDKIEEIANNMSDGLKQIKIGSMTKKAANIKNNLKELANETADISTNTSKKIIQLGKDISKSKNADEVWKAAKKLDGFMPEGIKKGANLSYKDQLIYNAWRKARTSVNEHIDDIANTAGDINVKEGLKKLSNLYHAKGQITSKIGELTKPTSGILKKIGRAGKEVAKIAGYGYLGKKLGIFGGNSE